MIPVVVLGIGIVGLVLEITFMIMVNHGGPPRRQKRQRGQRRRPDASRGYSASAASSRIVRHDEANTGDRRAAHGLVDRSGLRSVLRDHPQYVGSVRLPRTGTGARAHFRPVASVAPQDHQELGREPASAQQVASLSLPYGKPRFYSTDAVESALLYNTGAV